MTFNPAIPQRTDTISGSQPPILVNFDQLNAIFDIDHISYTFATQTSRGYHKKITFNDVVADPNKVAPITSLYTKKPNTLVDLFFQPTAAKVLQLTYSDLITANGAGFMPGGLQIRCGTGGANGGGMNNNIVPPFGTACLAVVAIGTNMAQPYNTIKATITGAGTFTLRTFNSATGAGGLGEACYYIAIGY